MFEQIPTYPPLHMPGMGCLRVEALSKALTHPQGVPAGGRWSITLIGALQQQLVYFRGNSITRLTPPLFYQ